MTYIDWISVAAAADFCAREYRHIVFSGVYGVPRGGLILAVIVSHKLGIPLLKEPNDTCLIIDDVYESGETLDSYRAENPGAEFFVMAAKSSFMYGLTYRECSPDQWLVFPWEDRSKAQTDKEIHRAARQSNL